MSHLLNERIAIAKEMVRCTYEKCRPRMEGFIWVKGGPCKPGVIHVSHVPKWSEDLALSEQLIEEIVTAGHTVHEWRTTDVIRMVSVTSKSYEQLAMIMGEDMRKNRAEAWLEVFGG